MVVPVSSWTSGAMLHSSDSPLISSRNVYRRYKVGTMGTSYPIRDPFSNLAQLRNPLLPLCPLISLLSPCKPH